MKYVVSIIIFILLNGCHDRRLDELGLAVAQGNINQVMELVNEGVDVNGCIGYEGCDRPLEIAAKKGHLEIVIYLVEHGAKINIKTKVGNAVFFAASYGKIDVVRYLLSKNGRLVCDKFSFDRLMENMIQSGNKEIAMEVKKTWIAP